MASFLFIYNIVKKALTLKLALLSRFNMVNTYIPFTGQKD